jgi:hypothetical protein
MVTRCQDGSAYDVEHWVRATGTAYAVHHWAATWKGPRVERRMGRPYREQIRRSIERLAEQFMRTR